MSFFSVSTFFLRAKDGFVMYNRKTAVKLQNVQRQEMGICYERQSSDRDPGL